MAHTCVTRGEASQSDDELIMSLTQPTKPASHPLLHGYRMLSHCGLTACGVGLPVRCVCAAWWTVVVTSANRLS